MDLKFTFGGESPDHDHSGHGHGGSAPGVPLPLANGNGTGPTRLGSTSTLELRVAIDRVAGVASCEARSGDGVSYARAERPVSDASPAGLAPAVRSVLARAGAALPEPLILSVTGLVLDLGGDERAVLEELGIPVDVSDDSGETIGEVNAALQARTGLAAGTPIRVTG